MELTLKYWSNANPDVRVSKIVIATCVDLKDKINGLLDDRPDIDNVEIYQEGQQRPWTSLFNVRANRKRQLKK